MYFMSGNKSYMLIMKQVINDTERYSEKEKQTPYKVVVNSDIIIIMKYET